ncbi:MAG: YraN family protein, partial [Terrimicrobiaceae bacterium]|nr:YraN family protein [Terrimicrobiaceae bacterium]
MLPWPGRHSSEAPHLARGRRGERLAASHLRQRGFKILRRNFRAPGGGEIDLVCRDGELLVFVEVKTRSDEQFGRPAAAVNARKRRLLLRAAFSWLRMLDMPDLGFRFDIVEVVEGRPAGPLGLSALVALWTVSGFLETLRSLVRKAHGAKAVS